jgi:hypothetical protein
LIKVVLTFQTGKTKEEINENYVEIMKTEINPEFPDNKVFADFVIRLSSLARDPWLELDYCMNTLLPKYQNDDEMCAAICYGEWRRFENNIELYDMEEHDMPAIPELEEWLEADKMSGDYIEGACGEDRKKYIDIVWDMLQNTYSKIGGIAEIISKEDLLNDSYYFQMVYRKHKIVAVFCYMTKNNRTFFYCGSDGSKDGMDVLCEYIKDEIMLKKNKSWIEVSGDMEYIFAKQGWFPVPNKEAKRILDTHQDMKITRQMIVQGGIIIEESNSDGYHYERLIDGKFFHKKIMFGNWDPWSGENDSRYIFVLE